MSSTLWAELEQEPYEPEEFVERLAWRATNHGTSRTTGEDLDAAQLQDAFIQAINNLTMMHEKQKKKCQQLEQKCREEETNHRKRILALIERNRSSAITYKSLDEKINSVATKVVHLGDQLESVNTPRSRDVEALRLIKHFEEFLRKENLSPVFTDKSRLHEAADIIQKLQLIAQDLPPGKFVEAQADIDTKYNEIQKSLVDEFIKGHKSNDRQRMKELAGILSQFKRYSDCIDAFIEQIQTRRSNEKEIFKLIVPLCEESWATIHQVFPNPQQVMSKFVLNIFHGKIKEHIEKKLLEKNSTEAYLNNLDQLYSETSRLKSRLSHFNLGNTSGDINFLSNLTKNIFKGYLESYISDECRHLNDKCTKILQKFYESKGHVKKQFSGGNANMQELKREIHEFIASKANINLDVVNSYGGETFLNEEVAINILQLTKKAFMRCQVLSNPKDLPSNSVEILGILISYLLNEHIDYALEIGLQGIPSPESKTAPDLFFFDVVCQTNAIIHLFEKQFSDSLIPLVASTPKYSDCLQRKKSELTKLERKVDTGLDRTLNTLAGWVRTILNTEQKKSDFNPSFADSSKLNGVGLAQASSACLKVVKFVNSQLSKIRDALDGKNIEIALTELGFRLHRIIYDHLQQFTYSPGVMAVICDVQEYRKCVADFKIPMVNSLFETLYAMSNLLILPPENLRGACQGDQLKALDRTILDNWIQLRTDYKSDKLGNYL